MFPLNIFLYEGGMITYAVAAVLMAIMIEWLHGDRAWIRNLFPIYLMGTFLPPTAVVSVPWPIHQKGLVSTERENTGPNTASQVGQVSKV